MKELSAEERYKIRLKRSRPLVDDFYAWLKYQKKTKGTAEKRVWSGD